MSGAHSKRKRAPAADAKKPTSRNDPAGEPSRNPAAAARRAAILDAALHVFAEHGYESARLDEVAARAGVAKGTLYLYFKDKEDLFEAMVRSAVAPIMGQMGHLATAPDVKAVDVLRMFYTLFQKEVLGTDRKLVLRLIMSEGPRFPRIAEFYYREVVSHGIAVMQAVARRAVETGEFSNDAAARFPQLIIAPLLMAVTWDGLFGRQHPLDMPKLLDAHLGLLSGQRTEP
jgi:AcrR family transcriptional regulator